MIKWDNEKELAKVVVDHLKDNGWTIYPEINDIDIVATKPDAGAVNGLRIIGIECKKHFNLTVLAQAESRKRYVDEVYIAVTKGWKDNESFGCKIAKQFNIGVYFVDKYKAYCIATNSYKPTYNIHLQVPGIYFPRKSQIIDKMLDPKAIDFAEAGQQAGKHWSVFQKTVGLLTDYVRDNPGVSLKDAIENIKHHYSNKTSAHSSLTKMFKRKVIETIVIKDKLLYIKETNESNS